MKAWWDDKEGKTPSCYKLTLHDQSFLPFGSKENLRIRSGRRRRWVGHIDCRRDTSVHRELRKQTITQECIVWISQESKRLPTVSCILFRYSRIWHNMPCHPGAQWQVFEPTHSPPFRHFCRQLAERQKQASRWVTAVNCWREASTECDYLPLILSSLVSGCLLGNCFLSSVLLRRSAPWNTADITADGFHMGGAFVEASVSRDWRGWTVSPSMFLPYFELYRD